MKLVDGSSAGNSIDETITSGNSKSYKVASSTSGNLTKDYNVEWISKGLYAYRDGATPKIKVTAQTAAQ